MREVKDPSFLLYFYGIVNVYHICNHESKLPKSYIRAIVKQKWDT